jgi:hypothetical protein
MRGPTGIAFQREAFQAFETAPGTALSAILIAIPCKVKCLMSYIRAEK